MLFRNFARLKYALVCGSCGLCSASGRALDLNVL